ncbi:hypothetical protein D0Z07_3882 [Hyphodiscus hymeniophilus]|uniref:DUF7707 domain-containing protein n=1 Tax=Hyphodiscus hymeniophilus TaxID=353542 RepID=A0A9P6VKL1_9HELO|nr:hypothetical protein D0Z07_3882 [Hyphodiscus hymeniophilus]
MFVKSTIAVALLASFVAAQGSTANSTIDPTTVDNTLKSQWCASEISTCGTLCGGTYDSNSCDPGTLNSTCTCTNGSAPGLQYYAASLDAQVCQQIYSNCITAGANDKAAQDVCTANQKKNCGTLDIANFTASAAPSSTSSSSSSASATAAATTSPAAGTSASTSSSKAAAATMMALGREYGSGVVAVGVAAAFGLMI